MNEFRVKKSDASIVERFVNAQTGAQFVGIHPKTLERLARDGTVPGHPVGKGFRRKRWRFLLSELDGWLRARTGRNIR